MTSQESLATWESILPAAFYRMEIQPGGAQQLVFITENIEDYCGYSAAELMSGEFDRLMLILPEDLEYVQSALVPNHTEPLKEIKFRLRSKGGQVKTFISRSMTKWVDGVARWREGLILDVTEQAQRERAMRVHEQFLAWVAQTAKIGGWEIDVTSMTIRWSEEIRRIRETEEGDEVDIDEALQYYDGDGRVKLAGALKDAIESGASWDIELTMVTAKGNRRWIRDVGIPEVIDGKCVRIKGVLQDITDTKLLHLELAEFKEAVSSSSIVSIADLRGNIQYANRKFEEISQYHQHELIGRSHAIVNSGYHPREFWANMWKTISSGKAWRGEVKNKRKDGSFYWVDTFIIPLKGSGETVGSYLSIRNDITEKKENESRLKNSLKRAEESDRLKSTFLANVSHELRTPMNAIMGLTELLERSNSSERNRVEFTKLIYQRGKDLLDIVNDILDMSRIETNQISLVYSMGSLNELFERIQSTLHDDTKYLRNKTISIRSRNELPDALGHIEADFTRLHLVLSHLLTNACKFTEQGMIEYGCRLLDTKTLLFHVQDTGIGIAVDQQAAIFEPFRRMTHAAVQQSGGSGLGLAICKGLVGLWGGKIWVESTPDVGSVFYFTLPYRGVPDPSAEKGERESFSWAGKRVLLVEDDPVGAFMLKEMFDSSGLLIALECVTSGLDAFDRLKSSFVDLLLLDLRLPDIDGRQVAIVAQEMNIPIVVISAYGDFQTKEKCGELGLHWFLAKPVNQRLLLDTMYQAMTKQAIKGP